MLVIFAAFRKEAAGLFKIIKLRKRIRIRSTDIYDGTIKNKRIIICITGMGKSNALFAVSRIIKMNLDNPVFIIQGISGAVVDNLNIGDLVFYESIKNLEKFKTEKKTNGTEEFNLSYLDDIESSPEVINVNFDFSKKEWEDIGKNSRILKASGGLVSYIVTEHSDKDVLSKIHGVEAIDMESYYIADAAINNGIMAICLRSISDTLKEPIPELITRFNSGNFICKFNCLAELLFSKTKSRSMLVSGKNITKACRNLNYFINKTMLPYFGYK
jgi:adenosylhomocysteine nucleosidase